MHKANDDWHVYQNMDLLMKFSSTWQHISVGDFSFGFFLWKVFFSFEIALIPFMRTSWLDFTNAFVRRADFFMLLIGMKTISTVEQ